MATPPDGITSPVGSIFVMNALTITTEGLFANCWRFPWWWRARGCGSGGSQMVKIEPSDSLNYSTAAAMPVPAATVPQL